MGQVKSKQINIVIEPAFVEVMQDNEPNVSEYIRKLIMKDLTQRGLITPEVVMKVFAG